MKELPLKHPASGGSWKRNADGSLKQIEKSTEPNPGKSAPKPSTDAKATASTDVSSEPAPKKQENGNV